MSRGWQWSREGEARLVRTRAWAENLANGGRSRGRAAVRGEDEADGWGLPVSVLQREGRGRVQRPCGPAYGPFSRAPSGFKLFFFFLF